VLWYLANRKAIDPDLMDDALRDRIEAFLRERPARTPANVAEDERSWRRRSEDHKYKWDMDLVYRAKRGLYGQTREVMAQIVAPWYPCAPGHAPPVPLSEVALEEVRLKKIADRWKDEVNGALRAIQWNETGDEREEQHMFRTNKDRSERRVLNSRHPDRCPRCFGPDHQELRDCPLGVGEEPVVIMTDPGHPDTRTSNGAYLRYDRRLPWCTLCGLYGHP